MRPGRSIRGILALGALALSGACQTVDRPIYEETLVIDARERSYTLYLPESVPPGGGAALLVGLHGGLSSGSRIGKRYGFDDLAEREGIIAVYPDAVGRFWNDGRADAGNPAREAGVDDVRFIIALIDELLLRYAIDPRRVYVAGVSIGGLMAFRLACESAERFAAVAAVTAAMPEAPDYECAPSRPVSLMIVNGTDDGIMPFDGGDIRFAGKTFGRILSTGDTVAFWTGHNGCPGTPEVSAYTDADPGDGTTVSRETYGPCRGGSEVVLVTVTGGGHSFPGGNPIIPDLVVGNTSNDIRAEDEIWAFFRRHKL